jgi:hypothetical protein
MDEMADDLLLLKNRKSLVRVRRLERTVRVALVSTAVLACILVLGGVGRRLHRFQEPGRVGKPDARTKILHGS